MTDKELLEKAAKAAGFEIYKVQHDTPRGIVVRKDGLSFMWMPLIDDGDALRLAAKLFITIGPSMCGMEAYAKTPEDDEFYVPYGNNMTEATRRAIVRAAASLADQ